MKRLVQRKRESFGLSGVRCLLRSRTSALRRSASVVVRRNGRQDDGVTGKEADAWAVPGEENGGK
jgi:hypothetical protein